MDEQPKKPSVRARKKRGADSEIGNRKSEIGNQEQEVGNRKSVLRQAQDDEPETQDPKPETRDPVPETRHPKPETPDSEPQAPPTHEPEDHAEERQPVNVFALAQFYLTLFADLAFQRMGLHADAVAGVVVKDMEQAKAAVDITGFLADQLMPKVGDAGRRELMSLVRDLRLNYAKQAHPQEPTGE